jgi:aminopeptidase N
MLVAQLGEDVFKNGIRAYLKKHAYGNAATADLWKTNEQRIAKRASLCQ